MQGVVKIIHKETSKFKKIPNLSDYEKTYNNFTWGKAESEVDYFKDNTLNAAYNVIDRHTEGKRRNKVALFFEAQNGEKEEYTYADLKKLTNKFANVLKSQGVQRGDRIFLFLPTIPERYITFLGILKLGAVVGTLFSAFQEVALLDRLLDSGATVVVTNSVLYPRIEKIWKNLPNLEKVIIVERGSVVYPKDKKIIYFNQEMKKASPDFKIAHMKKDDSAYMLYTSGTTGKSKGVIHAHHDILQAIWTTKFALDVHEDDIYWCTADSGWVTGVVYGIMGIWGLGGTSVIFEGRFSPAAWYKVIQDYRLTVWYTAPTAIRMLMGSNVNVKDFDLSSLRFLASVGEPLNPEAIWWSLEAFGLPFHDNWWMTELGGICIANFAGLDIKPGSMGKPMPGVKAAIIDDQGKELPKDQEGNLALWPETVPSLMKTIWNNEEKYKSYFRHGWYISGDRAYLDKDGYFWFIGRADDVIKTMGERVGPFEVESVLVEYPDVIEAGVIGKPDALRGEIIKAFVVLKAGVEPTEELKEKLKEYVKKHLAGHAYPREIEFIDKLPKTRSGKIMRRVLKAKELGLPVGDTSTLEDY
ncbi:MAG: acetyl-CoA synthetase, acetyl-CoA synthetase [Candidatus Levybacteria bacterium]|nr:acetyl-CoA synthetase, acetyl-CoA synthetase [Candidatus Levybacteria bacterium]